MKFTLSWLKDHLETDASLDAICERLTMIGLEVEHVDDKAAYKPFVIAEVLSAEKHPQADKLKVLSVDTGTGAPVQVVCGAPMRGPALSAPLPLRAPTFRASMSRLAFPPSVAWKAAA